MLAKNRPGNKAKFCVAIAARAPFEGVTTFLPSMRIASEIQSWGEGPYRVSCTFEALAKQQKNSFAQGSLKFREVSNSFWEATRREKTRLKKVSYLLNTYLLSQSSLH